MSCNTDCLLVYLFLNGGMPTYDYTPLCPKGIGAGVKDIADALTDGEIMVADNGQMTLTPEGEETCRGMFTEQFLKYHKLA